MIASRDTPPEALKVARDKDLAIARIAGVICEAKASSWERQQRRISEIETKQD